MYERHVEDRVALAGMEAGRIIVSTAVGVVNDYDRRSGSKGTRWMESKNKKACF